MHCNMTNNKRPRSYNDATSPRHKRPRMPERVPLSLFSLPLELLQRMAGSLSYLDISNLVAAAPRLYLSIDKDFSRDPRTVDGMEEACVGCVTDTG